MDSRMNPYANLTPDQARVHDNVLDIASYDGADCRDVLDGIDAPATDKAAVAEVLGGPGAGDRYLAEPTSENTTSNDYTDEA